MRSLLQELRVSAALLLTVLLYGAVAWALLTPLGRTVDLFAPSYGSLTLMTWGVAGGLTFVAYLLHLMLVERPTRPLLVLARDIRANILPPDQLLMRLTPVLVLVVLLNSFTALKAAIPAFQPFAYDTLFADIDRMIFGTDPWRLTHAVLGSPIATWLIQFNYNVWFVVMWMGVIYAAIKTDFRTWRAQYLLAFCLVWILCGSVAAILMSSAGPCYYGHLVSGPNPFAPLMDRLAQLDIIIREQEIGWGVSALEMQAKLWELYQEGGASTGAGISAMPSLHVATSVLMARAAFALNRKAGLLLSLFALVIWIGSVHLGWHYAVDGMVSLPLALMVWSLAGRIVRMLNVVDFPAQGTRTIEILGKRKGATPDAPEGTVAPSAA